MGGNLGANFGTYDLRVLRNLAHYPALYWYYLVIQYEQQDSKINLCGEVMYRIGYPFWKFIARCGVPLKLRIDVLRDKEAGVFVATSNDLRGLVAEAATMDELIIEVNAVLETLLTEHLHAQPVSLPTADLRLCPA